MAMSLLNINENDASKATLSFQLFPNRNLQIQLLNDISDPYSKIPPSANFALLNARRIVSIGHVAAAANHALIRNRNMTITASRGSGNDEAKGDNKSKDVRGLALETIICAGGSSHVGNVLKDFGFQNEDSCSNHDKNGTHSVIALGWDCTDAEMAEFIKSTIGEGAGSSAPLTQLSRDRTDQELKDIMKAFKLTKEDIEMESSSLEHAVVTRIATKFIT